MGLHLDDLPQLLKVSEVATVLRVHKETVLRMIREGKMAASYVGRGWMVEADEVRRIAREGTGKPRKPVGRKPKPTRPVDEVLADMGRRSHLGGDDDAELYRPGPDQLELTDLEE